MNYLQDRRVQKKRYLSISYFVVIFIILFYFRNGLFSKLSYVSSFVFHPVILVGNNVGGKLGTLGSYFLSKGSLSMENEQLRQDLADARAKVVNYEALTAENASLKDTLGRKDEKINMLWSGILLKPNHSPYDTLVIDVGADHGLKVGDKVFAYGDVPIGSIAEIDPDSSKVVLYSSAGEKTEVLVGDKNIVMSMVGRGGGNFEMNLLNDIVVQMGDKVVLPGSKSYVVGIMEKVISDPRESFQKVLLVSPVNIQELKFVEVEI